VAVSQPGLALEDLARGDGLGGTPGGMPAGGEASSTGGLAVQFLRVFVENKMAVVGLVTIVLMILLCFAGPAFYHTNQTNESNALIYSVPNAPPSARFPLGTDNNGYDMLGRIMYGGQVSLEVGFAAAALATALGVLWGATAGYVGRWLDAVMMRIVDVLLSLPTLLLLIVLAVIFRPSEGLLIVVIGLGAWLTPARLVRGETLSLRTREYVQAVTVMGGGGRRIVLRHLIPNTIGTIIVNATFQVADAILYLAALGFIGLGVPSPQTDWGSMLSSGVDYALSGYWWEIYPTGVAVVLVVVALNFVGDALRDAFEVRLQRR
jgi:peptide/nickel transport system permease protein